jgi:transposase
MTMTSVDALPDDAESLKRLLLARDEELAVARAHAATVAAEAASLRARAADDQALIVHLKLQIEKLRRERFGQRSERSSRLLDQLELQLEELEASATEDELVAERAAARTTKVAAFTRQRPARKPFPEHLPRERVIVPGPTACPCCGGARLSKLGEDVTETLEVIPRQWKVIQHVREKFSCRDCESINQAPAPFHVVPRGWAGASLLAMILFEKYGQHQPLNRQAERYAREGVPLSLSTLADQVGMCCTVLRPIRDRLLAYVLAAERLHGDDITVPVLAKGKTIIGRYWTYVRDDRPFGGRAPPAAVFFYSRDRSGEHPQQHLTDGAASCRPTPTAATASCMRPTGRRTQSWKRPAGPTRGASSSSSPISRPVRDGGPKAANRRSSRRLRWKRSSGSTRCSISSAASTVYRPSSDWRFVRNAARHWSWLWKPGCVMSGASCPDTATSPAPSTTCSSAGPPSPASSRTEESVSPTTRRNERYAAWR